MTALVWQLNRLHVRRAAVRPWMVVATQGRGDEPPAAAPGDAPPSRAGSASGPGEPPDDRRPDDEAATSEDAPATRPVTPEAAGPEAAGPEAAGPRDGAAPTAQPPTAQPPTAPPSTAPPPTAPPPDERPTTAHAFPPPRQYAYPPQGQFGGPPPADPAAASTQQTFPPPGQYVGPPTGPYGFPAPAEQGGPPPGQFGGAAPGPFGGTAPGQYGGTQPGQYGATPPAQYGGPPPPGQYAYAPPGEYGGPPAGQYGAPPGEYGAPPGQYGAPPGQYGYPGQYGTPPPPAPKRRRRGVLALAVVAVLLVAAAGAGFWYVERSARAVALLAADAPGADPFTPTLVQSGSLVPTTPFDARANPAPGGDLDGLYLDSAGSSGCNRAQLESILGGDPGLAAAWAAPLGVAAPAVASYVTTLTPVRLRADTRLTSHRNSGGRAQPYAATLQAGTAVLVDDRGLPRVRCADGAPLTGAQPLEDPVYGDGWTGFDPAAVTEIRPAGAKIVEFGLVNPAGEEPFRRPAGTTGDQDVVARPDSGRLAGAYFLTGNQTRCDGLVDCTRAGSLTFTSRFAGCPDACTVSDPELGENVPLNRDGAVWRASGTVPTQYRAGRCDAVEVPYSFSTTFTITESRVVDGVWTATRLRADHEVRAPETAACVSVVISWSVDGSGGG